MHLRFQRDTRHPTANYKAIFDIGILFFVYISRALFDLGVISDRILVTVEIEIRQAIRRKTDTLCLVVFLDDGPSSLCLQLAPHFAVLERGPSMLYWNVRNRFDGPLAIRIGHHGLTRVSLDLSMEHIHHPEGSSAIRRIQIYRFGVHVAPSLRRQLNASIGLHTLTSPTRETR